VKVYLNYRRVSNGPGQIVLWAFGAAGEVSEGPFVLRLPKMTEGVPITKGPSPLTAGERPIVLRICGRGRGGLLNVIFHSGFGHMFFLMLV